MGIKLNYPKIYSVKIIFYAAIRHIFEQIFHDFFQIFSTKINIKFQYFIYAWEKISSSSYCHFLLIFPVLLVHLKRNTTIFNEYK